MVTGPSKSGIEVTTHKSKNEFDRVKIVKKPFPFCPPPLQTKNAILGHNVLKVYANKYSRVVEEIGVDEHTSDARFQTGSRNKAVL